MITILIPTWNSEKYIQRAITSILENGYENIEIMIMDNQSTDKTKEIVKSIKDKRIFFISKTDKGMYGALNRGIKSSSGEIIGWIGCDDRYEKGCLGKIAKAFEKNEVNWMVGEGKFIFENRGNKIIHHHLPDKVTIKEILIGNPLISPSVFFRKSFFEEVGGFNGSYKLAADYDLWIRFALLENPLVLRIPLSVFSYNDTNASSKRKIEMYLETIRILRSVKNFNLFLWKAVNIARMYAYIGANLVIK